MHVYVAIYVPLEYCMHSQQINKQPFTQISIYTYTTHMADYYANHQALEVNLAALLIFIGATVKTQ